MIQIESALNFKNKLRFFSHGLPCLLQVKSTNIIEKLKLFLCNHYNVSLLNLREIQNLTYTCGFKIKKYSNYLMQLK